MAIKCTALLWHLVLLLICHVVCRYDYLPYFYSRVFEYEGSSRKVWWQFYGDNGTNNIITMLAIFYLIVLVPVVERE